MSAIAATRAEIAAAAVASLKRFSMLPEVTLRILEVVRDERCTARDLDRVVSTDPALCLRILRVVNSAFYGLPQPVTSVERAIVLLGAEAIRSIAMAASFGRLIGGRSEHVGESAMNLWLHSLAAAAAAKRLAEIARLDDPSEAFLCGLLHDVGFLVELQRDPAAFRKVAHDREQSGRPLDAIEDEAFGANHRDFGRELCEQWKLPPSIGEVIAAHDAPLEASGPSRAAACAVNVADALAAAAGFGFLAFPDAAAAPPDPSVVAALGIGDDDVEAISAALPTLTAELRDALAAG